MFLQFSRIVYNIGHKYLKICWFRYALQVALPLNLDRHAREENMISREPSARVHGSSTDNAHNALRELIVQGRLEPGSWIVESDLTDVLKMSRTPIPAALQWLQHEGYVVARGRGPKTRMMVVPLTLSDARELYGIVGRIEGMAGHY